MTWEPRNKANDGQDIDDKDSCNGDSCNSSTGGIGDTTVLTGSDEGSRYLGSDQVSPGALSATYAAGGNTGSRASVKNEPNTESNHCGKQFLMSTSLESSTLIDFKNNTNSNANLHTGTGEFLFNH